MKRRHKESWKRERQRRRDAIRRKYYKHRSKKQFRSSHREQLTPIILPTLDEVPSVGIVNAPKYLSLLKEVKGCVRLFANIRYQVVAVLKEGRRKVALNIADIQDIDLPTTMVLNALGREMGERGVNISGNFPNNKDCYDFFVRTGFLNDKVDAKGMKFNKSEKTDYFTLNKGQGKLSINDTMQICKMVRRACDHLGKESFYDDVVSIIKEIAGNSIEWSQSFRDQWTLGVMFEDDRVTFSILDLGRGILDTIYRKFLRKLKGLFTNDIAFLNDVFDKQYSSSSQESNRYKGLPSIKKAYLEGTIQNLCVMTNNVLMCFDNSAQSVQYSKSRKAFNGTLYYWEINKQ